MGEWAERAIEEEMYGPRCLDYDETPCMCDSDEDFDEDDEVCPHGNLYDECDECKEDEDGD